jgi:CubicO group peptidase (beta-lactamase class C family)
MAYTWEQVTDPGEFWSYCNSGWDLAGKVIANVTGQTYEAAMKELIFEPLGLDRAFFFAEEAIVYSAAAGHNQNPGQDAPVVALPWPIPRASNPAGAIISNVQNLLTFCNFHMGDGRFNSEQVLTPTSVAAMQTVEAHITEGSDWGLGWALETNGDGTRIIRHGGGTNGHITMMSAIPAHKFAISVLTNSSKGGEVIKAVEEWAFDKYCGVTITKPEPTTLTAEQLERLTGVYRQTASKTEITVEDDHLLATIQIKHPLSNEELSLPAEKLIPISEWEVMTEEGSRVQFIPGAGNRPRFLRMGRLARREV